MDTLISYAGLEAGELWSKATRLFVHNEDMPARFRMFIPLFPLEMVVDMPYEGGRFVRDSLSYHRVLSERLPQLYTGENRRRCFDANDVFHGGEVVVDQAWARAFPQYQPFVGERLYVHMIGGGHQAAAVPESIFPRAGALLVQAERDMGIEARAQHFSAWLAQRLEDGDPYDSDFLEEAYLTREKLAPVCVRQRELGRAMQEISILRELHGDKSAPVDLYTEISKRCEGIRQYVPFRCACDCFEPEPLTRGTARLLQLHFESDQTPGDFWMPYQDASEYIDKRRMTLDVRSLCEGFQIAPVCDAETRGGVYPDRVRVVVVRDRSLPIMAADTLNNPAYGSGMNPQGKINRLVYVPGSASLLSRGQLGEESHNLACRNTHVEENEYLHMRELAEWQEHKGRLIDAMYRRESALSQTYYGARSYDRARDVLDSRVERFSRMVAQEPETHGQRSGYDADIEYLRRKAAARASGDMSFVQDQQREMCIESGYAMRTARHTYAITDLMDHSARADKPKAQKGGRQQAANGEWFEQLSLLPGEQ